jgi:hypothetical protein
MKMSARRVMAVAATVGATLAVGGTVVIVAADSPDPHIVYACVKKHGEIAIVGPRDICKSNETPQRWSLPTPTGEQGVRGVPGQRAALDALAGLPCATPGATAGTVVEVRHYGNRGAPTLWCRVPGGRFIDHGDLTVTDIQTGLTWEKKVQGGDFGSTCLSEPHGVGSACTWDQAMEDWLDVLNGGCPSCGTAGGFAGYVDWRLPTLAELLTIVDPSGFPAIDPVFGPTEALHYWSESADDAGPPAAAAVNFSSGSVTTIRKGYPLRVRAVRGP